MVHSIWVLFLQITEFLKFIFFSGISISILSYDNRLQLGVLVDKSILSSQKEAQTIADDIFDSIKLLHKELQEGKSGDLKNNPLKISWSLIWTVLMSMWP